MVCGGQYRTPAVFCGHPRPTRHERPVFASGPDRLHSGYRSQEKAAEGAGLNAQGHRRVQDRRPGMGRAYPRGFACSKRLTSASWGDRGKQGPTVAERVSGVSTPQATTCPGEDPTAAHSPRKESHDGQAAVPVGSAVRAGRLVRRCGSGASSWLARITPALPGSGTSSPSREVCADLGISRRTFYEWRAKGKAPRCITLPNGSLRVRRSEYHRWLAAREEAA
jgi:predicted DNA-binding transcriptional regulator AlpA